MKSFTSFLTESEKSIVFTFGRFQPPTIGHEKLLDAVAKTARASKSDYHIYASQTQDKKKNPLDHQSKIKYIRKMFPKHARQVILDTSVKNALDICSKLYDEGYNQITMVVGGDRVTEFETLLNKYNNVKTKTGFYNFEKGVQVVSAGDRDPDAEGVTGMSASKMRAAAAENDFSAFTKGLPPGFKEGKQLFLDVRKGLKDIKESRSAIEKAFQPKSKLREQYIQGDLFKTGDLVRIKESGVVGNIVHLGTNYLLIEKKGQDGSKEVTRQWVENVVLYHDYNTPKRNVNKILKSLA